MSRRYAKHLPATNGWRQPNGQMAPFEPSMYESAADGAAAGTVACARCGDTRQIGKRCQCERGEP